MNYCYTDLLVLQREHMLNNLTLYAQYIILNCVQVVYK